MDILPEDAKFAEGVFILDSLQGMPADIRYAVT